MKEQLLNLCTYLVYMGIYPVIAEELLGVSPGRNIKLFLDVDYVGITGNIEQLAKAKSI